ncbi:DUF998 domain-containing protein (plasmid) [Haloferacaceae archaeon DSL9]
MISRNRIAALCGIFGLVTLYGSIFLAVVLSPSFQWTTNALSDLGAVGAHRAWIFNGGLILSGFFFVAFAFGVFTNSAHRIESLGALVIALVYFLTMLVGVFPYPTRLHNPVALGQFFLIPIGLWIYGTGNVLRGATRLGATTIGLGIVALAANVWLIAVFRAGSMGLALPELAIAVPFDAWAGITIWRLYRTPHP